MENKEIKNTEKNLELNDEELNQVSGGSSEIHTCIYQCGDDDNNINWTNRKKIRKSVETVPVD